MNADYDRPEEIDLRNAISDYETRLDANCPENVDQTVSEDGGLG